MKNMIIAVLLLALMATGCKKIGNDFLEKPPSVDVTKDTIFSNVVYAKRFLTGAYATLHYGWIYDFSPKGFGMDADILESLTDIGQTYRTDGAAYRIYYSGQYSAATENNPTNTKYSFLAEDSWVGIRKAYIFMENIDRVPDASALEKKTLKAEAKMIVAMHYCDMYRHFGGLPWIDHAIGVNERSDYPRLTSLATLNAIVKLIDEATPDLPWTITDLSNEDGRFTQASALGLKARILLFGASPLFNNATPYLDGEASQKQLTWHGNYDANLWKRAADAAAELIQKVETQSGYRVIKTGNPRQDFQDSYYKRGNGEILISTRIRYKNEGDYDYLGMFILRIHGIGCPTQEYVNMFSTATGVPISDPASGYSAANPYKNRDPRLYETVLVNDDSYAGRTAQLWVGGIERLSLGQQQAATGYGVRKFLLDNVSAYGAVIQFPYLRLTEIYLSYAEAANELNNGPTTEAYRCVNLVRNRVGLRDLPAGLSKSDFREAILTERACEFGYEEVRWFDLIRWKRASDFTKTLHGLNTFKNPDNTFRYELFELPPRAWQKTFSPKWYLSALPPNEVNKGYGLIQNPGW